MPKKKHQSVTPGLPKILNYEHVSPDVDLQKHELKSSKPVKQSDIDEHETKLAELAASLGMSSTRYKTKEDNDEDDSDDETETVDDVDETSSNTTDQTESSQYGSESTKSSYSRRKSKKHNKSKSSNYSTSSEASTQSDKSGHSSYGSSSGSSLSSSQSSRSSSSSSSSINIRKSKHKHKHIRSSKKEFKRERNLPTGLQIGPGYERQKHGITDEQEYRQQIDSVISNLNTGTSNVGSMQRERIMDKKASKLEEISRLKVALAEDGVNCDGIKNLTLEDSLDDIDSTLHILNIKNDRTRYSTIAGEVLVGGAEMLGSVFDGTRSIPFINWAPDYRGYHSTVGSRIHRMRFETSQVVEGAIGDTNINPAFRILMELLPGFIMFPIQNSKNKRTPGIAEQINSTVSKNTDSLGKLGRSQRSGLSQLQDL